MTRRTRQVGELLREELTDIIRKEMDDHRLAFWTITRVDVTPDLRSARVYVSVLGTDDERAATIAAMKSGSGFIHRHLKPRLRMRQIPSLEFKDDRSFEHAAAISQTLHDLKNGVPPADERQKSPDN
jgi:ribosome-binding factor A